MGKGVFELKKILPLSDQLYRLVFLSTGLVSKGTQRKMSLEAMPNAGSFVIVGCYWREA